MFSFRLFLWILTGTIYALKLHEPSIGRQTLFSRHLIVNIMFKYLELSFILSINFLSLSAQNIFEAEWKQVEAFEKKGLTRSAQKIVQDIFQKAVKQGVEGEQVKAAMHLMSYENAVVDENENSNIFFLDSLVLKTKAPVSNILLSMQAEILENYFNQNRWQFANRTTLQNDDSKDYKTWSPQKFIEEINRRYLLSLGNVNLLQTTAATKFNVALTPGKNSASLMPTLFDVLLYRANLFFENDQHNVLTPTYKFLINEPAYFAASSVFNAININSRDTASGYYHALKNYQKGLRFHEQDAVKDAFLDIDMRRLQFVHAHATLPNKDSLYKTSLQQIVDLYPGTEAAAEAKYLIAGLLINKSQNNKRAADTKQALALLKDISNNHPKTSAANKAKNLVNEIVRKDISITVEKVNSLKQPFRVLTTYKNVSEIHLRLIKVTGQQIIQHDGDREANWAKILSMPAYKNWIQNLPLPDDNQQHTAEIKVDQLPTGVYYLLAASSNAFAKSKDVIAMNVLWVSDISYVLKTNESMYVLDRNSGKPVAGATVQLWKSKYDYTARRYNVEAAELLKTNGEGLVQLPVTKNSQPSYFYQITKGTDELFLNDNFYRSTYYPSDNANVESKQTFIFTDRKIYRPGQTVFFKGIVIGGTHEAGNLKALENFKSTVLLQDVNGEQKGRQELITNSYGSYSSSFLLPATGLTGSFALYDSATGTYQSIQVEEYKRPKFIVELKQPAGEYKVNDSVKVEGKALAYAGNAISNALVNYRVVREVRWPIWWYGFRGPAMGNERQEIANGQVTSDDKGNFYFAFKAIPDETADKKNQPTFYYRVLVDVTDINGETRSEEQSVSVSYQPYTLNIVTEEKIKADKIARISITSKNTNDVFVPATATITIESLQQPTRIFRERYWPAPDQFVMDRETFYSLFPYDPYAEEHLPKNYPLKATVFTKTIITNQDTAAGLIETNLIAGWYKITVSSIAGNGERIYAERYIEAISEGQTTSALALTLSAKKAEPGEKTEYNYNTAAQKIFVIQHINTTEKTGTASIIEISKNKTFKFNLTATEVDRGGISIDAFTVLNNRLYEANHIITVPWSNKELQITYNSFRDKLIPGSKEKWSVSIKGNKAEKIQAEILAGMYDKSLDQYAPHTWPGFEGLYPTYENRVGISRNNFMPSYSQEVSSQPINYLPVSDKIYRDLIKNGWENIEGLRRKYRMASSVEMSAPVTVQANKAAMDAVAVEGQFSDFSTIKEEEAFKKDDEGKPGNNEPAVRTNLNETAFFLPQLLTDEEGNVRYEFEIPEALTQWKLMTFAHSKELASAYDERVVVTQKPMMVQPNAPRFVREGDAMEFSAKIANLTTTEVTGTARLLLFDALTNNPVDGLFQNVFGNQYFTVPANGNVAIKFPIKIPFNFNSSLSYKIIAESATKDSLGNIFTDGEGDALPVLTNRMLVTETLPLSLRNTSTKSFSFDKLKNADASPTLTHHALTVEYSSNPAWYAVQSLPYLMEYPYECAEQNFNRFYANALASSIVNKMPRIKAVFDTWLAGGAGNTEALLSNLQKNEALKSALLQETPWVLQAKNENEQKKNIAVLFDAARLAREKQKSFDKLLEIQSPNGGFSWFTGGPDDRYMTQYILTGIGHLKKLNVLTTDDLEKLNNLINNAMVYLDKRITDDYKNLVKYKANLTTNQLSQTAIQYLYMRSFFTNIKIDPTNATAVNFYDQQSKKFWLSQSKYMQGMIAIANKNTYPAIAKNIVASLKENAIFSEEMGMYWKEHSSNGYYWHQAPIESHSLLIEAFTEIDKNEQTINDLKTWLLRQKQTQGWESTKATAEACYALLLSGSNWLAADKKVQINLGNSTTITNEIAEAGTGYFKQTIKANDIKPAMGNIQVSVTPAEDKTLSWGAVYWQYFEDLDKITKAVTPLQLDKKLFIQKNTATGPTLIPIQNGTKINVGDKITVRIELRVDRDMEYVHMKDMRASGMEPINVISSYKYQDGLGYYESTRDASTNFFFSWLPKGTYVFEYSLFASHTGNYSNGITTIQCMYAPEFTSHSEGVRIEIGE